MEIISGTSTEWGFVQFFGLNLNLENVGLSEGRKIGEPFLGFVKIRRRTNLGIQHVISARTVRAS